MDKTGQPTAGCDALRTDTENVEPTVVKVRIWQSCNTLNCSMIRIEVLSD